MASVAEKILLSDIVSSQYSAYDIGDKKEGAICNDGAGNAIKCKGTTVLAQPSTVDSDKMLERMLSQINNTRVWQDPNVFSNEIRVGNMRVEAHRDCFLVLSLSRKDGAELPKPSAGEILDFCDGELRSRGSSLACFVGNKESLSRRVDGPLPLPFHDLPILPDGDLYALAPSDEVGVYVEYDETRRGMAILCPSNIIRLRIGT